MDDEYIHNSEWAPIAAASTSKHHSESSEEEPLRKIPKLSRVLCETTSQDELQAAVLSNNPCAKPEITSQARLQAAVLSNNPGADPETTSQDKLQTTVLSNNPRAKPETTSQAKLQAAVLSNYPSTEHADMQSDPISDISDMEFEDEDEFYKEICDDRKELIKELFDPSNHTHLLGKGTKLHDAVLSKNSKAVHAVLLSEPNLIDVQDTYGNTALHYAAGSGYRKIVKILLDKGANTDLQDDDGRTPVHDMLYGTYWGTGKREDEVLEDYVNERYISVMKQLLAAGADPHLPDKRDWTPLHTALRNDNNLGAEMIIAAKGGNNHQDEWGKTPLHVAMEEHWHEIAKKLLTTGVSTRIRDEKGRTPFHMAVDYRGSSIVNNFVDADSENDLQDSFGQTPLHFTAREGRVVATRKLLFCGAHPHVKAKTEHHWNEIEEYPLQIALKYRRSAAVEMILSACVLRGIVIDWEEDLHWKKELAYMSVEKAPTLEFCQDMCEKFGVEVRKMKRSKLRGTAISIYDFATKHERKLAPYLKNKNICSLLRSINLEDHFPNYGGLLTFKIKRARKRNTLIASCLKCFSVMSKKFPSLLKINLDAILECLNERDMLNFVKAFKIKS